MKSNNFSKMFEPLDVLNNLLISVDINIVLHSVICPLKVSCLSALDFPSL